MQIAASCDLQIDREMTPDPLKRRILSYDDREICRILPFAASSDLQIDREMPINRETPNPLKRRILWFGVSEHGALQRMERFKGWSVAWSVTEDGAFQRIERFSVDWQSQSISNLEDAA
jgi:hypothetical protein